MRNLKPSIVHVYKTDFGDYVVSVNGMWISGAYETEEAARKAGEAELGKKSAVRKALHEAQKKHLKNRK